MIGAASLAVLAALLLIYHYWPRTNTPIMSADRLALDPTIGPAKAKITIIEYMDFGCDTCKMWEEAGIRQELINAYGDQVRFVWRDFPVLTLYSIQAAEAGQCALDQGMFWQYAAVLYTGEPDLSVPFLRMYAAQAGLDFEKFNYCLTSGMDYPKVDANVQDARSHGFIAPPAFVVNGQRLAGYVSFDDFKKVIDRELAK